MEDKKDNTSTELPDNPEVAQVVPPGEVGAMPLLDHIEELRFVLLKSISAFVFFCVVVGVLVFKGDIMDLIYWPLDQAQKMLGEEVNRGILTTRGPMSVFSVIIQVIFLGGFGLALPFMLYFASTFIAPGLTPREKRVLVPVCLAILLLFILGATFSFKILLPMSVYVSLFLNALLGFHEVWDPADYIGLVVWMTVGLGFVFQFPLVLILLQYLGIISAHLLRHYWRHALVGILAFSALITPGGDPIIMGLMAVPLYLLYEMAIFVGAKIVAKKLKEQVDSVD